MKVEIVETDDYAFVLRRWFGFVYMSKSRKAAIHTLPHCCTLSCQTIPFNGQWTTVFVLNNNAYQTRTAPLREQCISLL